MVARRSKCRNNNSSGRVRTSRVCPRRVARWTAATTLASPSWHAPVQHSIYSRSSPHGASLLQARGGHITSRRAEWLPTHAASMLGPGLIWMRSQSQKHTIVYSGRGSNCIPQFIAVLCFRGLVAIPNEEINTWYQVNAIYGSRDAISYQANPRTLTSH